MTRRADESVCRGKARLNGAFWEVLDQEDVMEERGSWLADRCDGQGSEEVMEMITDSDQGADDVNGVRMSKMREDGGDECRSKIDDKNVESSSEATSLWK